MKTFTTLLFSLSLCLLAGCSEETPGDSAVRKAGAEAPIQCAAMLMAAMQLINVDKTIAPDPQLQGEGLVATMIYVNMYGLENELTEPEAFADIKQVRDKLLETRSGEEITRQAKKCVRQAPPV